MRDRVVAAACMASLLAALPVWAMGRRVPKDAKEGRMERVHDAEASDVTPNEWRGAFCAQAQPSARIVESPAEWSDLWRAALNQPAPVVDFSRHFALAVFLGSKPTGGFGVEFLDPISDGRELLLRYRVREPAPDGMVTQAFTQPYAVKLYRRTKLRVALAEAKD
ncbi:MAG: protease complex subunit PrcB family protein [Elusimicrobia bacterium]|nr:protease complex subunit PrcB family protein [Elusimicrobiota bacterium]